MFGKSLKNIEDVTEYLTSLVADRDKTLKEFDKHRVSNELVKFMYWSGIEFIGECFTASLAQGLLDHISNANSDGMAVETQYDSIIAITERRIMDMRFRIGNGSTNMSANLEEDFENKFWIELKQKFNERY